MATLKHEDTKTSTDEKIPFSVHFHKVGCCNIISSLMGDLVHLLDLGDTFARNCTALVDINGTYGVNITRGILDDVTLEPKTNAFDKILHEVFEDESVDSIDMLFTSLTELERMTAGKMFIQYFARTSGKQI